PPPAPPPLSLHAALPICRPPPEMVNVRPFDVPPPDGFITVTVAEPAAATSAAPMLAVSWIALTKVVAHAVPFHCTVEPATKFVRSEEHTSELQSLAYLVC